MNIRIYIFARSRCLTGLIPILVLSLLIAGCGKKTFPKPISAEPPAQIRDLQAQVRSKGVELSWSIPPQPKPFAKRSTYLYSVLRTELEWGNRNCLDCPAPTQQEIHSIDPAFLGDAKLEGQRLTWIDTAVSSQHAYRYQIAIVDSKKHMLFNSNPVAVKVVPSPGAVKNLVANTSSQGILLQWKAPGKDEKGHPLQGDLSFLIERHSPGGAWENLSKVPIRGNSFLDSVLASKQSYDYRVTPTLLFEETTVVGEPAVINQARAPEALPPPPPSKVWVIPTKGNLEVHWVESEGKVGGYHVYRKEGKEIIRLTENPIQHAPYMDRSVKRNAIYSYAVSAVSIQPEVREGLLSKWAEIRSLMFE